MLEADWLLLRGLAREAAHWGDFPEQLRVRFPGVAVHTLDLPGAGDYYADKSPASLTGIMRQVREEGRRLNLSAPPRLLALSLGGMVAWEWMLNYPDEISGAVLINTSLPSVSPFYRRLRWQSYARLAAIIAEDDVYRRELAIIRLVCNRRDLDSELAAKWHEIQCVRPVNHANLFRQLKAAASYRPSDSVPRQPVLLLNSLGDRLVSPLCSRRIAERYGFFLKTHPWAGHDLVIDDSEWLLNQLKIWAVP